MVASWNGRAPHCPGKAKPTREEIIAAYNAAPATATYTSVAAGLGISREWVRQSVLAWERSTGERLLRPWERRRLAKSAEPKLAPPPSVAQRLLRNVVVNGATGCWEFPQGKSSYPSFRWAGTNYAYRVAYLLWCGPLDSSLGVVRTCRNHLCINPWHLEALPRGSAVSKYRRQNTARTKRAFCKRGHELTPENLLENPAYVDRNGTRVRVVHRICRICRKKWQAGYIRPEREKIELPPLRTIKGSDEREIEAIIRAMMRVPRKKRIAKLIERLSRVDGWGDWVIERRPKSQERWFHFLRRTRNKAWWIEWALCRILDDARVQEMLVGIALGDIDDPLLRREIPNHVRVHG